MAPTRKQLLEAREAIQSFAKTYAHASRAVVLTEAKAIIFDVTAAQGLPFALARMLRDARQLLKELEGTTLKADPAQVELAPSHAGLAALAQPKTVVQTKAEVDFSPFWKGGA